MKKDNSKKMDKKRQKLAKKIDKTLDYEFDFLMMRVNDLLRDKSGQLVYHNKIQDKLAFLQLCAMVFNDEKLRDFLDMPEWEEKIKERKQLLRVIHKFRGELKDIEDKLYKSMIDSE